MKNLFTFAGGETGAWIVDGIQVLCGDGVAQAARLDVIEGPAEAVPSAWVLRGFTSNVRYATTTEITALKAIQPPIARREATCAALIPIRKSQAWWDLAQDRRRAIFEDTSHHNRIGMDYLPQIARRLHHCRDLDEPFDFLTWFEFAPEHTSEFDALLARLRSTEEWSYVDREIDIRVRLAR